MPETFPPNKNKEKAFLKFIGPIISHYCKKEKYF